MSLDTPMKQKKFAGCDIFTLQKGVTFSLCADTYSIGKPLAQSMASLAKQLVL